MPDDSARPDLPTGPEARSNRTQPDQAEDAESHAGGFTLDLSSKKKASAPKSWRRQRKKADPLTTKIFDFTQPKSQPKPPPASDSGAKPVPKKAKKKAKKSKPRRSTSGATLADLLDPETLARLRSDD